MLRKRFALLEKIATLAITYCFFVNYGLAEPGPTISQLMKEPISLWDWGMFRVEQAGERASKTIMRVHNLEMLALSEYSWDNNEITISFYYILREEQNRLADVNQSLCKEVRQTALQGLIPFHPVEETELEKSAGIALDSWFSHPGDYQTVSRSADIGKKLARITFIEVHLPDDSKTVTCKARITELQPSYKVRQR